MRIGHLMACFILFTICQEKASQSDQHNKGKQDICSDPRGKDCEEAESRRRSIVQAAYERDWERVRTLVQKGPDLDATDPDGRTLAMMAAESGQWDMVHWLRERGADINLQDGLQRSVLHIASSHRQWHDMKMLVNNGSDINAVDRLGKTPTIIAASYKEWDIVQWLIERGADINARDGFGRSVLLLAASHNNWRFVKWLLSKGADPMVTDQNRRTLLHLAAVADNLKVVQILVEDFGVDFTQEDKGSNTPINLAAISNDPKGSVYNYLVYMREMKSQTSSYRRGNAEYKIRELSLLNRIKKMYDVMSMGESSLDVKMYGRVILVLGNLRSGKSTLVQYLTDGTSKLMSQPVVEGSGLFKIVPINGTAIPTSVYPRLVNYKEKGAVFCDGPRFSDMGTISQDLTAMHFLKKVTEKFRRVKLVFTVSHLAVKRGMNSVEFITFLQHVTSFITNFTHFSNSSCIVVTKFDGPRGDVPDSQLEKAAGISISKAAESMLEELEKKDLPVEKRTFFKKAVEFLLVFLEKEEWGKYERIKVFRRPNSAGPLDRLKRMNFSRDRLSEYIFDRLSYVKVMHSHFDYPVSSKTLATVYKFEQATNREMTSAMASIANHIEHQLFSRAKNSEDVFKIQQWLREGCKRVEEIMELIAGTDDPRKILLIIRMALEHVNIYPRKIATYKIEYLGKFIEFLQKIMKNMLKTTPWEWRDPFRMVLVSIRQTRDWYDFLSFLYQRLITHKFQVEREKYDVNNPYYWGLVSRAESPGISINQNNIESFLKVMDRYEIRRIDAIDMRHFHDFEINSLNKILKFTIKEKTIFDCDRGIITGSYVSLRSVRESGCYINNLKNIKIFATNTIFIDRNLVGPINITMIAPTIEITEKGIDFTESDNRSLILISSKIIKIAYLFRFTRKSICSVERHGIIMIHDIGDRMKQLPREINDYVSYSIDHLKNAFVSSNLLKFLAEISTSKKVSEQYSTATLFNDLTELENNYNALKDKIDMLPLYESLLKRIETYVKNPRDKERTVPYRLAQTHLNTVVMSKVSSLKQERRDNLVLSIADFFKLSTYIIEEIKEKGNQIAADQFKETFQNDIQKKIDEGQKMVKRQVRPAVDKIFVAINKTTIELIEAVRQKIEELKKYKEELEDYKEKLEKYLRAKQALGILGFIGQAVSSLGAYGAAAGALINGVCAFGNALNRHPGPPPQMDTTLPAAVSGSAGKTIAYGTQDVDKGLDLIRKFGHEIEEQSPDAFQQIKSVLNDSSKILTEIKNTVVKMDINRIKETLIEAGEQSQGIIKKYYVKFKNSKWSDRLGKAYDTAAKFASTANILISGFGQVMEIATAGDDELEQVNQQIKQVEHKIKQLEEFEAKIKAEMLPMLVNMKKDMDKAQDNLAELSSLELSLAGWKIDNVLRDSQRKLSMMTDGFGEIQHDMNAHMDNLRAAMDFQISIFQKLQDCMEQSKMVSYMKDITNPNYFKQGYPPEIEGDINKLDLMISSNMLLSHRARALGALKQWVFPFAHDYLGMFKIPKQLNYEANVTDLVKRAKEELEKIQMTILTGAAVPTKRDRCTLNNDFYKKYPKGPFYIWRNSENIDFIVSLLSGEEVTTNVDIRQKLKLNAVKFRYIKLSFHVFNERKQQEFNKLLRNFEVKMTHLGNSHFHCDGKIYTMTGDSLEIRYSLLEDPPGKHTTVNEIFNKLRKGDVMLSPYATWKFQLLDSTGEGNFGKLLSFVDDVDVIFEGEGQYLNEDCLPQCSNNVDEYYKVDGTV